MKNASSSSEKEDMKRNDVDKHPQTPLEILKEKEVEPEREREENINDTKHLFTSCQE